MPTTVLFFAALVSVAPPAMAQQGERHALAGGWSAEKMLGTPVRGPALGEVGEVEDLIVGPDGTIRHVVVEAGGTVFGLGAVHIGVPWRDVRIGPSMSHVRVPVTEDNRPDYPIFDGDLAPGTWRVSELIHDLARLDDEPFDARVHDVIFDEWGKVTSVVVDRRTGRWGGPGPYAHPYTGYRPRSAYDLGGRAAAAGITRFDYVRLDKLSHFSPDSELSGAGGTR